VSDEEVPVADVVEGCDEAEHDVLNFVKDKLDAHEVEGDVEFTLQQTKKGTEGRSLTEFVARQGDDARSFAKAIVETAEADCRAFFGRTQYTVRATGLRGSVVFTLTRPFTGDESDEEETLEVENLELPTYRGMANQAMRHVEGAHREMRYMARDARGVAGDYRQMCADLRTENARLQAVCETYRKEIEAVRNMDHARRIDFTRFEKSERRKDQVADAFGNHVLPLLGAKLLGPGGPLAGKGPQAGQGRPQSPVSGPQGQNQAGEAPPRPEQRTSIERKVETFIDSLERDQLQGLMQVLSPEQLGLLQALHGEVVGRREREKAARNQYAADVAARATAAASAPSPGAAPPASGSGARSAYAKASGQ